MPKLGHTHVDNLLEKFLTGFRNYSYNVEVFENPTRKEQEAARNLDGAYTKILRFIADGEKKRLWVWNSGAALHSDAWSYISKEIGDSRRLYKDWELVSGEIETNGELNVYYVVDFGGKDMAEAVLDIDYSWADKYIKGFGKKFEDGVRHEMQKKGWL